MPGQCPDRRDVAGDYGGDTYNAQIGSTPPASVFRLINSKTFHDQPGTPDDTVGGLAVRRRDARRQADGGRPPVVRRRRSSAHSPPRSSTSTRRRACRSTSSTRASGRCRSAFPTPTRKSARATFINEATGAVLGSTDLVKTGTSNGLAVWDNAGAPLPVTLGGRRRQGRRRDRPRRPQLHHLRPAAGDLLRRGRAATLPSGLPSQGIVYLRGWSGRGQRRAAERSDPARRHAGAGQLRGPVLLVRHLRLHVRRPRAASTSARATPSASAEPSSRPRVDGTTMPLTLRARPAGSGRRQPRLRAGPRRRARRRDAGLGGERAARSPRKAQPAATIAGPLAATSARARSARCSARSPPRRPLGADQGGHGLRGRRLGGELARALQRRADELHARPRRHDRRQGQPRERLVRERPDRRDARGRRQPEPVAGLRSRRRATSRRARDGLPPTYSRNAGTPPVPTRQRRCGPRRSRGPASPCRRAARSTRCRPG